MRISAEVGNCLAKMVRVSLKKLGLIETHKCMHGFVRKGRRKDLCV